jgi:nucleotide-binding universal stress UspA family protein
VGQILRMMKDSIATKLKDRLPYPFETIAVAVSFSPRYKSVIREAARMAKVYNAKLIVIHIGTLSEDQKIKITSCVDGCELSEKGYDLIDKDGPVVDTLLKLCKQNIVDLLIFGALKKETVLKHYVGSVARNISRKAKCSVLLMPQPKENPNDFEKIVVSVVDDPKTPITLATAVYIANHENSNNLQIVNEEYIPMFESAYADTSTNDETDLKKTEYTNKCMQRLNVLLDEIPGASALEINKQVIFGKPGHSIQVFAKSHQPDLLIVNSPKKRLGLIDRLFPHDLEHLLEDLPCKLLIVHSRGF